MGYQEDWCVFNDVAAEALHDWHRDLDTVDDDRPTLAEVEADNDRPDPWTPADGAPF